MSVKNARVMRALTNRAIAVNQSNVDEFMRHADLCISECAANGRYVCFLYFPSYLSTRDKTEVCHNLRASGYDVTVARGLTGLTISWRELGARYLDNRPQTLLP